MHARKVRKEGGRENTYKHAVFIINIISTVIQSAAGTTVTTVNNK